MRTAAPIQKLSFSRRPSAVQLLDSHDQSASSKPVAKSSASPATASKQEARPQPAPDLTPILTTISEQISTLIQQEQRRTLELQQAAIELALAAAECLASRCVQEGRYSVQGMIEQAIASLGELESVVLVLNPADHQLLKLLPETEATAFANMRVQSDPHIKRGECRVQTSSERLSFSIANRLESIRGVWMESLDDTAA